MAKPNPTRLKSIEGGKRTPSPCDAALRTLALEGEGIAALHKALTGELAEPFNEAVRLLKTARGRVIVSGIGKSGHVGQKIAATFASTGTPAFFVHPSEASHGDLGMITREDVILALSWSGETVELKNIITYSRRFSVPLISLTSRRRLRARPAIRRLPLPAAVERGLPAWPGAHHVDDDDAGHGRLPRHRTA